jgi:hypothetical protein
MSIASLLAVADRIVNLTYVPPDPRLFSQAFREVQGALRSAWEAALGEAVAEGWDCSWTDSITILGCACQVLLDSQECLGHDFYAIGKIGDRDVYEEAVRELKGEDIRPVPVGASPRDLALWAAQRGTAYRARERHARAVREAAAALRTLIGGSPPEDDGQAGGGDMPTAASDQQPAESDVGREELAIALAVKHADDPDWDIPRIAREVGVDRTVPYRWKKFLTVAMGFGKYRPRPRRADWNEVRGSKVDGKVEAWDGKA